MSDYDYYQWKVNKLVERKKQLLNFFNSNSHTQSANHVDTSIVELVIRSNIHLTDNHIKHILGLREEEALHNQIYDCLIRHIAIITNNIATNTGITNISHLPLTNLFRICFNLAMEFRPIFFCPYEIKLVVETAREFHLRPRSLSSVSTLEDHEIRITKFCQRFNQNWILVYLFKRLFAILYPAIH